ncbi:hypothetical protein [Nitrospirillum iridis]|uniref:Uncharacterized protein n=1 Tax=Nitrospirillum iridis TaxID=765888 RepID=A0A7X0AU50_9PROT|nr:hypothetical protein [Nitrospirillum iridis]MBB6250130.1 hypothetical protein [Nitrospirillum iridis]
MAFKLIKIVFPDGYTVSAAFTWVVDQIRNGFMPDQLLGIRNINAGAQLDAISANFSVSVTLENPYAISVALQTNTFAF